MSVSVFASGLLDDQQVNVVQVTFETLAYLDVQIAAEARHVDQDVIGTLAGLDLGFSVDRHADQREDIGAAVAVQIHVELPADRHIFDPKVVHQVIRRTGITKHAGCHTLRHSFATALLADGYDIRTIQELLGHKSVKSTMIHTHVLNRGGRGVRSPLDGR